MYELCFEMYHGSQLWVNNKMGNCKIRKIKLKMSQLWEIKLQMWNVTILRYTNSHFRRYKVAMSISKDADVRNISQMLD